MPASTLIRNQLDDASTLIGKGDQVIKLVVVIGVDECALIDRLESSSRLLTGPMYTRFARHTQFACLAIFEVADHLSQAPR